MGRSVLGKAKFSPHSLRHTTAALLLQSGTADAYYVQRLLGHADIALTVGTYGSWHQPDRRPNLDALDRTMKPNRPNRRMHDD